MKSVEIKRCNQCPHFVRAAVQLSAECSKTGECLDYHGHDIAETCPLPDPVDMTVTLHGNLRGGLKLPPGVSLVFARGASVTGVTITPEYACTVCGHEQDSMDRACDACSASRVVAIGVLEQVLGPKRRGTFE